MKNDLEPGFAEGLDIVGNPTFQTLKRERARLAWGLSILVLAIYYGYVFVVAFAPKWLGERVGSDSMTIGFPVAAGMFVVFWLLTGLYSWRANGRFDALARTVLKESGK